MLYSEFVNGTGCKDTPYNYDIYKKLECLYMNWDGDITHAEIYEMGKKLVDNSLTENQIKWNDDIDEKIRELQFDIRTFTSDLERYTSNYNFYKEHGWEENTDFWKKEIKYVKREIRTRKQKIKELKTCKYV